MPQNLITLCVINTSIYTQVAFEFSCYESTNYKHCLILRLTKEIHYVGLR